MQDLSSLRTLVKKLEEIKESWQIYAIFEEARKEFNEEFAQLQKDKESLIESFNATSAKNAFLVAQNKELEARNKELESINSTQNQETSPQPTSPETDINLSLLQSQCNSIQKGLHSIQTILQQTPHHSLQPLEKLEVSYQKYQKLLANPAKKYVTFDSANLLSQALQSIEEKYKILKEEFDKLSTEIQNLQDSKNNKNTSNQTREES